MKNPLTPGGIEPATFGFVAQHVNHCATAVPPPGLLMGVYKMLSLLVYLDAGDIRYPQSAVRIGRAKTVTKWIWLLPFHIYCPTCVQFGVRSLHKILLKVCELRENRSREGYAAADVSPVLIVHIQLHAASRSATCILTCSSRANFVWSFQVLHLKLSHNNTYFSYGCFSVVPVNDSSSSHFQRSQFLIKSIHLSIAANFQINLRHRPF